MTETTVRYTPEIGQALLGAPWGAYECPLYIEALLERLFDEVRRAEWNRTQSEFESPLDNVGAEYQTDYFVAHSYVWTDCECVPGEGCWETCDCSACEPNFYVKKTPSGEPFEVRWYKHARRGNTINRPAAPAEVLAIFDACMASVRAIEATDWESRFGA